MIHHSRADVINAALIMIEPRWSKRRSVVLGTMIRGETA